MNLPTHKILATSVRYALPVGALVATGAVFAQDAASADPAESSATKTLQTVVVTGSRIRSADVETAQPIIVMDRTQIEHQGFNSVLASSEHTYATASVPGAIQA